MNKLILIGVGIAIGAVAFYIYNENKPSEFEKSVNKVERKVEKAANQAGDFINDTADKIDREVN